MSLAAGRQLKALVAAGATVLSSHKLIGSPTFSDGAEGDAEVRQIADELWGNMQPGSAGEKKTGAGRVIWGRSPGDVLAELNVPRDFRLADAAADAAVLFAHRATQDRDIYFVENHRDRGEKITAAFRVIGRVPELWNPETGVITSAADWREVDGTTEVKLALESHASVFVIFRAETAKTADSLAASHPELIGNLPIISEVNGPWRVRFTPGWGAPDSVDMPRLQSWTEAADHGVRHYSGSATYTREFDWSETRDGRVWLDLGKVAVVASVTFNGRPLGTAWKSPYAFDITDALKGGRNQLEVRVTNVWTNRLILDSGLPEAERKTWVTWNPYKPRDALLPSGLLGPVTLRLSTQK
jgi:hypothetical protein